LVEKLKAKPTLYIDIFSIYHINKISIMDMLILLYYMKGVHMNDRVMYPIG